MGMIDGIALTPSLFLADRDEGDADTIRAGGRAVVSSQERARAVMSDLGMSDASIRRALAVVDPDPKDVSRATLADGTRVHEAVQGILIKHQGPGQHKGTGTPQSVHGKEESGTYGGKRILKVDPADIPGWPDAPDIEDREDRLSFLLRQPITRGPYDVGIGIQGMKIIETPDGNYMRRRDSEDNWGNGGATREHLAYQVAKRLGLGGLFPAQQFEVSPSSFVRGGSNGTNYQEFLEDAFEADEHYDPDEVARQDVGLIVDAYDYLVINNDRHNSNWMIDGNDNVWLIDHGLVFDGDGKQPMTSSLFTGHKRDVTTYDLLDLDAIPDALAGLESDFDALRARRGWEAMMLRAERLKDDGTPSTRRYQG